MAFINFLDLSICQMLINDAIYLFKYNSYISINKIVNRKFEFDARDTEFETRGWWKNIFKNISGRIIDEDREWVVKNMYKGHCTANSCQ